MSIVSEALRNEETRLRPGDVLWNSRRGRDPLGDARQRVRAQRRVSARIPTMGEPAEARQDDETVGSINS